MTPGELADTTAGDVDREEGRWEEHLTAEETDETVAIAPHGGHMEPGTGEQALRTARLLESCSGWAYCGYADDGSARERYYTTSTEIRADTHELLSRLTDRTFELAIAFHGYVPARPHPDVYVGGTLDRASRETIAESIARESGLDVRVARPDDGLVGDYGGVSPANVVNRLGRESIQLEQTEHARHNHRTEICHGLVDGVETLTS